MKIHCLSSWDEVHACASAWQALLTRSSSHPVFSSPAWFLAYLQAFPQYQTQVLILEDAGVICAIAPLVRDAITAKLSFIDALADYQDFIVDQQSPEHALTLLKACLSYPHGTLRGLREDSALHQASRHLSGAPMVQFPMPTACAASICYFTDLSRGYPSYLQAQSGNFRFNLRKAERRAIALDIQAQQLQPDQFHGERIVEEFLRLHLLRFPRQLFSRPAVQAFCRNLFPELYRAGLLQVFALIQGENLHALHLSLRDRHSLALWNGGFDPQIAAIAPGKLLLQEQMQYCHRQQLTEFDFLRGDESYKQAWSTGQRLIGELSW